MEIMDRKKVFHTQKTTALLPCYSQMKQMQKSFRLKQTKPEKKL